MTKLHDEATVSFEKYQGIREHKIKTSSKNRKIQKLTSDPSLDQTDPSSTPMTPAPMMIIFSGTEASLSAPVDETMCSSSISTPVDLNYLFLRAAVKYRSHCICRRQYQISSITGNA